MAGKPVAADGVQIPVRSGGQQWLVSWHPPPAPPDGIPRLWFHRSAGYLTGRVDVPRAEAGVAAHPWRAGVIERMRQAGILDLPGARNGS